MDREIPTLAKLIDALVRVSEHIEYVGAVHLQAVADVDKAARQVGERLAAEQDTDSD